jgi:hypothetical protein
MTRVWIYDLNNTKKHREAVEEAKRTGQEPPVRWHVSWYDNTGTLTTETTATKTQAKAHQTEIERTLQNGTYVDTAAVPAKSAELAVRWLYVSDTLRTITWSGYRRLLDNHLLPRWGELSLDTMLDEDIEAWLADLPRSTKDGGSGLPPSHARLVYLTLFLVLTSYAPIRIPHNPTRRVKIPRTARVPTRPPHLPAGGSYRPPGAE